MNIKMSKAAVIVGTAAVLVVVGVMTALALRQPRVAVPPGSPQATVATYLTYLQAGQVDDAYNMVSPSMALPWSGSMTREMYHQQFDGWSRSQHRVTLIQAQTSGSLASVTVDISSITPGLFGAFDQTNRFTLTLERQGTVWLITGPSYLY